MRCVKKQQNTFKSHEPAFIPAMSFVPLRDILERQSQSEARNRFMKGRGRFTQDLLTSTLSLPNINTQKNPRFEAIILLVHYEVRRWSS